MRARFKKHREEKKEKKLKKEQEKNAAKITADPSLASSVSTPRTSNPSLTGSSSSTSSQSSTSSVASSPSTPLSSSSSSASIVATPLSSSSSSSAIAAPSLPPLRPGRVWQRGEAPDSATFLAVLEAVQGGSLLCFNRLVTPLPHTARCALLSLRTAEQQTLLHVAAQHDYSFFVEPLLHLSAGLLDVNAADALGRSALHLAALNHAHASLLLLLGRFPATDLKDADARTALHHLACSAVPPQHPKLLRAVLARLADLGASFNEQDRRGNTPLHLAAQHAPADTVDLLCRYGVSEASLRLANDEGLSPLHLAALHCRLDVAAVLLAYGCSPGIASPQGTPLQIAARFSFDALHRLLQAGPAAARQLNPRRFVAAEAQHGAPLSLEASSSASDLFSSGKHGQAPKGAPAAAATMTTTMTTPVLIPTLSKDLLFQGEKIQQYLLDVRCRSAHSAFQPASLIVTQFRCVFFSPDASNAVFHSVYLGAIIRVSESTDAAEPFVCLECRDFRAVFVQFPATDKGTLSLLKKSINLKFSKHHPAFSNPPAQPDQGWRLFNPDAEFYERMRVSRDHWTAASVNHKYKWISKYPKSFLIPRAFTDLKALGNFRVECKIPVLTWSRNGRALLRASYPFDSFMVPGGSLKVDNMCDSVFYAQLRDSTASKAVRIFSSDASRGVDISQPAEHVYFENFNFCTSEGLATSLQAFRKALFEFPGHNPTSWFSVLDKTLWMQNIAEIYRASKAVFDALLLGESVIFQSPSGDHPLPQVVSIVQMMLDSHYRTILGFCTLIEKEWIVMGHQFYERSSKSAAALCFLQFMDCLWQMMRQLPQTFEFTSDLLIFLLDEVYSERFGTFLLSNEKERDAEKLAAKTTSIWSWILHHADSFKNPNYVKLENPICPPCERVRLWSSYYLRYIGESYQNEAAQRITQCTGKTLKLSCVWEIPAVGINPNVESFLAPQNYISSLSTSLANFPNLTLLDLSSNFLSVIPRSIAQLLVQGMPNLRQLRLAHNDLTFFPAAFGSLPSLMNIDISNNAIANLAVLSSLQQLEILKGSHNQIKALPPSLQHLRSLNKLVLQDNLLTELPESISSLVALKSLQLDHNPLVSLPSALPPHLTLLSLSFTQFPSIPEVLYSARSLKHLNLRGLTERAIGPFFSSQISQLMNLQWLDISHNHIQSDQLHDNVFNLTNLEYLLMEANQLTVLPSNFQQLTRLKHLTLASNALTELPPCISGFSLLSNLSLSKNQIRTLPPGLALMPSLSHLEYRDNPLRDPPREVVDKGSNAVFAYMKSLLNGSRQIYRLKLMVVGQENVGKTSLIQCLRHRRKLPKSVRDSPNISTDGIIVQDIPLSIPVNAEGDPIKDPELARTANRVDVKLSVWDFAGQEVYYSTHQFFLSDRSIFILAWNLTLPPENSKLEHWLHSLSVYAPHSPVLIVGTCADKVPDFTEDVEKAKLSELYQRYHDRFPNLLQCCAISAYTGKGLDYIFGLLEWIAVRRPQMGERIPVSYLLTEEYLIREGSKMVPPTLDRQQFSDIAKLTGISSATDILSAATLLHQLGTIICFESDPELADLIVVDPQWLMDVFKTIITTKHSWCRSGVLEHLALSQIWRPPAFPSYLHARLLKILQKFGVLYFIPTSVPNLQLSADVGISLVPAMLPNTPPETYHAWQAAVSEHDYHTLYQFDFVPTGFFARLLTRLLLQIAKMYPNDLLTQTERIVWASGLIIEAGEESACIVQQGNVINLSFRHANPASFPTHLLNVVTLTMDVLIRGWLPASSKVQRLIPCIAAHAPSTLAPQAVPVEVLQETLSHHQRFWFINHVWPIPITKLEPIQSLAVVPKVPLTALEFGRVLGVGGFGKVYKGRYQDKTVAIKELLVQGETESLNLYKDLQQEAWNMMCNTHPNIVACLGICLGPPFCMVVEFMAHGDLYGFLRKPTNSLPYPLAIRIALDISLGLRYLHSNYPPVVHRDFKSPNVLLCALDPMAPVCAKVADLGISTGFTLSLKDKLDASVWLAPEVFLGLEYDLSSDIYSLAIVIWELLTRQHPYADYPGYSFEDGILEGYRPAIPADTDPRLRRLIHEGWDGNPQARPTIFAFVETLQELAIALQVYPKKKPLRPQRSSLNSLTKRKRLHAARLRALSVGNRQKLAATNIAPPQNPVTILNGATPRLLGTPLSTSMASCTFQTTVGSTQELVSMQSQHLALPLPSDEVRGIQHSFLSGHGFSTFEILGTVPDAPLPPQLVGGIKEHDYMIKLAWAAPEKDGGETITEYRLERIDPSGTNREMYLGPNLTVSIGKPPADSGSWLYQISACNSRGWSHPSPRLVLPTTPQPPAVVHGIRVRSPQPSQFVLEWDLPFSHFAPLRQYTVFMVQGEFSVVTPHFKPVYQTSEDESAQVASQHTWRAQIPGPLLPDCVYSFSIRSSNAIGDSDHSTPFTCRTLPVDASATGEREEWRSFTQRDYTRACDPLTTAFVATRFPSGVSVMILADGLHCGQPDARARAIQAVQAAAKTISLAKLRQLKTIGDQVALTEAAGRSAQAHPDQLHLCVVTICPISHHSQSIVAVRTSGSLCLPFLKFGNISRQPVVSIFSPDPFVGDLQTACMHSSTHDFLLLISPGVLKNMDPRSLKLFSSTTTSSPSSSSSSSNLSSSSSSIALNSIDTPGNASGLILDGSSQAHIENLLSDLLDDGQPPNAPLIVEAMSNFCYQVTSDLRDYLETIQSPLVDPQTFPKPLNIDRGRRAHCAIICCSTHM